MFTEIEFTNSSPVQRIFYPFSSFEYEINQNLADSSKKNKYDLNQIRDLHRSALDLQEAINQYPEALRQFQTDDNLELILEPTDPLQWSQSEIHQKIDSTRQNLNTFKAQFTEFTKGTYQSLRSAFKALDQLKPQTTSM